MTQPGQAELRQTQLGQLYQEVVLDHHKRPRNPGRLAEPTHAAEGHNPLCGDRLTITARVEEGRVLSVCCDAVGCAICRASGSMLTEAVSGRALGDVTALIDCVLGNLAGGEAGQGLEVSGLEVSGLEVSGLEVSALGPLGPLLHVRHFPSRLRCATLSWETLRRALESTPQV